MSWSLFLPFVLFAVGVGIVIWATERLLEGLVGLSYLVRVPFAIVGDSRRRAADLFLWGSLSLELSRGDHRASELGAVPGFPRRERGRDRAAGRSGNRRERAWRMHDVLDLPPRHPRPGRATQGLKEPGARGQDVRAIRPAGAAPLVGADTR